MSDRLPPSEYDGEKLCPRCGSGIQSGRRYQICVDGPSHEESCERYDTSRNLCDICEKEYADE